MNRPIVLRPEAELDLLSGRDWYEQQQAGLGDQFADAVDRAFARIEAMPELYAVVLKNVRRMKLERFPYVVYYRALPDRIEIIAVLHGSRDSRIWQERV